MGETLDSNGFYDRVPVFGSFGRLMDPAQYQPLPDDWTLGLADVVQSTRAIRENKYKAVNMAGAAVIAGVSNAVQNRDFPFVFGGDGASFAVPPDAVETARTSLAATAAWVRDELELTLRVAMVPVKAVRERGVDVQVARFGPSANVAYAMFSGGGVAWAEAAMKRGEFAVPPGPPGARPDLNGLSCRFAEIPAARGVILSVVVVAGERADGAAFRRLVEGVIELVENSPEASRPVPAGGPDLKWPPTGLDLEARASRASGASLVARRGALLLVSGFVYLVLRFGITLGGFVPSVYIKQLVDNSDFRKYDDGLRMVLDCTPALADELDRRLSAAAAAGVVRYGMHRQDTAMMTCFTPSPVQTNHVHFIDGAHGGYALAAMALKGATA